MSSITTTPPALKWGDIDDLTRDKSQDKAPNSGTDKLANKEVFMQLLVAQLKNQNPLNPADGIEFVTQLTQFTQLEQSIGMREELETIRKALTEVKQASGTGDTGGTKAP